MFLKAPSRFQNCNTNYDSNSSNLILDNRIVLAFLKSRSLPCGASQEHELEKERGISAELRQVSEELRQKVPNSKGDH